jgi:multiple sugar transport system substrate-binding protein
VERDELEQALDQFVAMGIPRRRFLELTGMGIGALSLSQLLAACGSTPGGGNAAQVKELKAPSSNVELQYWNPFSGPDGNFMKRLVDQFNAETNTVKVTTTTIGNPPYYTKLQAAAAAGTLPDVAIIHNDSIPYNAANKVLSPVDDLVSLLNLSANDFTQPVWSHITYKGKKYGIPLDTHTESFYWNKDLFTKAGLDPSKPPTDKNSFTNAAKAITDKAGVPGFMVVGSGGGGAFLAGVEWASLFYQGGGEWTDSGYTKATYNSDAGVNAAKFLRDLITSGAAKGPVESDSEIAAFKQGKNGMVFSGIWETTGYQAALGDKLGAGPIPKIFGTGVWAGSHTLCVTTKNGSADQRQAAYYFINWISKHSIEWAKSGQIPARKSVRQSSEFKAIPNISDIAKQVDDAHFFPTIVSPADMLFGDNGAGQAVTQIVSGKKDAKSALDASVSYYTQIIQQNKTKYGF